MKLLRILFLTFLFILIMSGGIPITIPFELLNATPLDKRFYSNNATERNNVAFRYRGMIHYTKGEGLFYVNDNFAFQPISEVLKDSQALQDLVNASVQQFFINNPAVVQQALGAYFDENPIQVSAELIAEAVENYFSANPVANPTAIQEAVYQYLSDNPIVGGGAILPRYSIKELPLTIDSSEIPYQFPITDIVLNHTGSIVTEFLSFVAHAPIRFELNDPYQLNGEGGAYPHASQKDFGRSAPDAASFLMYLSNDSITDVIIYVYYEREPGNWQYLADLTVHWPEDKQAPLDERTYSIVYYDLDGNVVEQVSELTFKFDYGQEFNLNESQLSYYPYQFAVATSPTPDGETLAHPAERKKAMYRANGDLNVDGSPFLAQITPRPELGITFNPMINNNNYNNHTMSAPGDMHYYTQLTGLLQQNYNIIKQDQESTIIEFPENNVIDKVEFFHFTLDFRYKWDMATGNVVETAISNLMYDAEYFIPEANMNKDEMVPLMMNRVPHVARHLYPTDWATLVTENFTVEYGNPYIIEDYAIVDDKVNMTLIDLFYSKKIEVTEKPTFIQAQDTGLKNISYPGGALPDHSGVLTSGTALLEHTKPFAPLSFRQLDGNLELYPYDFFPEASQYPDILQYFIDNGNLQFDVIVPDRYFSFPTLAIPATSEGVFIALIKNY